MTRKNNNKDLLDPKDIGTAKRAKTPKAVNTNVTVIRLDGFYGLLMIPVLVSMGYNVFLVLTGTDSQLNQIVAIPTLLFIAYVFIRKMWK